MKGAKTKVRDKASPEPRYAATSRCSGTRIGKANCEPGSRYLTCGAIGPSCSATRHRLKPTVVSITSARSRSRRRSGWPGRITLRQKTRLLADSRERICGVIDETRASSNMYADRWTGVDVHGCVCVSLTPETGVRNPYGAPTLISHIDLSGFFAFFLSHTWSMGQFLFPVRSFRVTQWRSMRAPSAAPTHSSFLPIRRSR